MPFVLAHVSDFHVSEFGDTLHDRANLVKRSVNVAPPFDPARFDVAWEEAGWRVVRERGKRRGRLELVDPGGYVHPLPSRKEGYTAVDPVERAAAKAFRLEARRAPTLARHLPSPAALKHYIEATPRNSNVRLLRAVAAIEHADAVVITGDLTDDGVGWELVEAAFAKWRDKGKLFAVAGNHDLFLFPIRGSTRPRPTHEDKRKAWLSFAGRIGLDVHPSGGWVRFLPEADAVIVGLDSCARPQRRFFRQNGAIGREQFAWLRELGARPEFRRARHKLVLLHHHVVPLALGVGRRAPSEIGMALDDARTAAEIFDDLGVTAVLHGHRHLSEQRQPAGSNFTIFASPSLTLGCRSGDQPSYWRIELGERMHATRVRVPLASIEQDEDPPSSLTEAPAESSPAESSPIENPADSSLDLES